MTRTLDHIDDLAVQTLKEQIDGVVIEPSDGEYDDARAVWNGKIDREPGLIVRCTETADVVTAVDFARENDFLLAVKSNGHDFAGNSVCDGGLVIDLSRMDTVCVNPETKTARIEPGAKWGDVYQKTQAFGLATPGGPSEVGVAGLTLGGGSSVLSRNYGLTIDNLTATDVVTASGDIVRASEERNPGLFWGLRGGGGNFGIVTSFEYELHEVGPEVFGGLLLYPFEEAERVLRFYREFMTDAPDELACSAAIRRASPMPAIPERYYGEPVVSIQFCYSGLMERAKSVVRPFREFGDPIFDALRPQQFTEFNHGRTLDADKFHPKSHYLSGLPDEAIKTIVEHTETLPGRFTTVRLGRMGGAINCVESDATAFPHRGAAHEFNIWGVWSDSEKDDEVISWVRTLHEALAPNSTGGVYVNQLNQHEQNRVRAAYGDNYDRLVDLKNEWDPENLFRKNQNIKPTT